MNYLFNIPIEIREKIYHNLLSSDLFNLYITCKNNRINEYIYEVPSNIKVSDKNILTFMNLKILYNYHNNVYGRLSVKTLSKLTNLRILTLNGDDVIKDEHLQNLTKLKKMDLEEAKHITNKGIKNLVNLTELNLNNNYEVKYDENIETFKNLKTLHLAFNFTIESTHLLNMTNLTCLNLQGHHNMDKEYYNVIKKLPKIKYLYVWYNFSIYKYIPIIEKEFPHIYIQKNHINHSFHKGNEIEQ